METHVYANDNEICSKASDGVTTMPVDPCWSPPGPSAGPVVIVYTNTAKAKNLKNGSDTVFICGTPLALRDVSSLENSTGNEPATRNFGMGVSSHNIKGDAFFTKWSPDVKVEGWNVCRHVDPMPHNH